MTTLRMRVLVRLYGAENAVATYTFLLAGLATGA
jgi:hypothetical protein